MEASMIAKALEGLVAAGPVATILGAIVWQLWKQNAQLRSELASARDAYEQKNDRLQAKMLRLAVRVQRAVEALAGLETPEVETLLDDADNEDK
jgi:hypothetical protein